MIYLMSKKYLKKNIDKLVRPNKYFIIDGENYGSVGGEDGYESISEKFNNTYPIGAFCPESELYRILKRIKNKEEYNEKKFKRLLDDYFHDDELIGGICMTTKAQATYGADEDINVFVVLPNVVYKILGEDIKKKFEKVIKSEDIKFVRTQAWIEDHGGPKKALKGNLSKEELQKLLKGVKKAEKKYGLKKKDYGDDD